MRITMICSDYFKLWNVPVTNNATDVQPLKTMTQVMWQWVIDTNNQQRISTQCYYDSKY